MPHLHTIQFRHMFLALCFSLAIFSFFSYPLPVRWHQSIPCSAENKEKFHERTLIPGDHLQLEYRFWLFSDMIRGKTPLFQNPYEFNSGDDLKTYRIHPQYLPFSAFYSLVNTFYSRAFAWNSTLFLSFWLTFLFSLTLYLKFHQNLFMAFLLTSLTLCIPYRFHTLLGGSPTGLAMTWVPLFYLGLYHWFDENRDKGAFQSGLALLFSYTTDMHVFYFSALSAPFMAILFYVSRQRPEFSISFSRTDVINKIKQCLIFGLLMIPVIYFVLIKKTELSSSFHMKSGRELAEIAIFTPFMNALTQVVHDHASIYLGILFITLFIAFSLFSLSCAGSRPLKENLRLGFFLTSVILIYILALGEHGIFEGRFFINAREWIPEYDNIRQPLKILCLAPTLLLMFFACGLSRLTTIRAAHLKISAILVVSCIMSFKYAVKPTLTALPSEIVPYKAIMESARLESTEARTVAIPLWPGDSHWSSLYEYAGSLYRIRMLNGYSPTVKADYVKSVFEPLKSLNAGLVSRNHVTLLKGMNIQYLTFHENAFPEKVSPFPVEFTRQALLNSPYLQLFSRVGPVYAFKIRSETIGIDHDVPLTQQRPLSFLFAARKYFSYQFKHNGILVNSDDDQREYLTVSGPDGFFKTPSKTLFFPEGSRWKILAKGHFTARFSTVENQTHTYALNDWSWIEVPVPVNYNLVKTRFQMDCIDGTSSIFLAILEGHNLSATHFSRPAVIPATHFFHAGYSSETMDGSVIFTPSVDPDSKVLYAPLALKKGTYVITCHYLTSDPDQSPGQLIIRTHDAQLSQHIDPATNVISMETSLTSDDLLSLEFHYSRLTEITIHSVEIATLPQ